jgi:hypothetical protein
MSLQGGIARFLLRALLQGLTGICKLRLPIIYSMFHRHVQNRPTKNGVNWIFVRILPITKIKKREQAWDLQFECKPKQIGASRNRFDDLNNALAETDIRSGIQVMGHHRRRPKDRERA